MKYGRKIYLLNVEYISFLFRNHISPYSFAELITDQHFCIIVSLNRIKSVFVSHILTFIHTYLSTICRRNNYVHRYSYFIENTSNIIVFTITKIIPIPIVGTYFSDINVYQKSNNTFY